MKIGFIIDSAAGLTEKEAHVKGWGFIPLLFTIDKKEYRDGIDIDAEKFYAQISIEQEVKTSATPPALILAAYEKMSKKYDHVIVYALSKELSSQTNNLQIFARDFNNIHVIDSMGVGYQIVHHVEAMAELSKTTENIEEIVALGNKLTQEQWGIALPKTMKWLVKGGRISPAVAKLANLFKIVPMIRYESGKLEKGGKGKDFRLTIIEAAKELKKKCHDADNFYIYHGENADIDAIAIDVESILGKKPHVSYCPPVIAIHIGPGVIGLMSNHKKK